MYLYTLSRLCHEMTFIALSITPPFHVEGNLPHHCILELTQSPFASSQQRPHTLVLFPCRPGLSHCLLLSKYASSANFQISQIIIVVIGQLFIMRNQARLSVVYRGAAIRPQAEHSLGPFSGSNVHALRSEKLQNEEVGTCRQTPQAKWWSPSRGVAGR